jgi:hypothetical protein
LIGSLKIFGAVVAFLAIFFMLALVVALMSEDQPAWLINVGTTGAAAISGGIVFSALRGPKRRGAGKTAA